MIQAEAFLWVLTHPGPSLSLQDFNGQSNHLKLIQTNHLNQSRLSFLRLV